MQEPRFMGLFAARLCPQCQAQMQELPLREKAHCAPKRLIYKKVTRTSCTFSESDPVWMRNAPGSSTCCILLS